MYKRQAEQSAAETEKPQETAEAPKAEEKKTTTYSWVNPKISGKTGEELPARLVEIAAARADRLRRKGTAWAVVELSLIHI